MPKLNKITMGTIIIIILVGFIINSMNPFNAGVTVLGSYLIIHGFYIYYKGEDFYKIFELGMDPQEFNYAYQGNGKYVQPESGKNIQFFDATEQMRFTQGIESLKPDFKLYGITLIIAVVLMSFSVTKMSDKVLYDHAVDILEDEFVNDPDYSHVDIRITYPNI